MTFWRLFYHIVFVTEDRQPLLRHELRLRLLGAFHSKAEELACLVHAVYVMPEHVHPALSIPPSQNVAAVVGQLKGASSHLLTHELLPGQPFAWRRGYGVFSFDDRDLPAVVRYINEQEQRHVSGRLSAVLESVDDPDDVTEG